MDIATWRHEAPNCDVGTALYVSRLQDWAQLEGAAQVNAGKGLWAQRSPGCPTQGTLMEAEWPDDLARRARTGRGEYSARRMDRAVVDLPIPEGDVFSGVQGICSSPIVSP